MTDHTALRRVPTVTALAPVGLRLVDAAERRTVPTARLMLAAFLEEVPFYRLLPADQLEGEVLDLCTLSLRTFFRTLREGRGMSPGELAEPRASAARRAEERVPLDAVLAAYHVGGRVGWEALCREAPFNWFNFYDFWAYAETP